MRNQEHTQHTDDWDSDSLDSLREYMSGASEDDRALVTSMLRADGEMPPSLVSCANISMVRDAQALRLAVGRAMQCLSAPDALRAAVQQIAADTTPPALDPSEMVLGRIMRWVPLAMVAGLLVVTAVTVRSFLPGGSSQPVTDEQIQANAGFALRLASDFATQDAVPTKNQSCCGDLDLLKRSTQQYIGAEPNLKDLVADPDVRVVGFDTGRIPPRSGEPCVKIRLSVQSRDPEPTTATLFVTQSMVFLPDNEQHNDSPAAVYNVPRCESTAHRTMTGWRAGGLSYLVVSENESTNATIRARMGIDLKPIKLPGCDSERSRRAR